ncbi:MAG: NAD(P)/FAD-dependent oxidoreductase [Clostridia bacterium]|nr:NAD(P)/FAD-dependent oxidoreductase [Clostridia bacterium]
MDKIYDALIVGAGASGLMASVGLKSVNKSLNVLILEKNEKIGKKIYITGKGKCNVTNNSTTQNIVENIVHNGKFLYGSLNKFSPSEVINFFEDNGCKLKTERGNRVFPVSEKASDIIKVFQQFINKNDVELKVNSNVSKVKLDANLFEVYSNNEVYKSKNLIIATGGKSYPLTGSNGDGYQFAKNFGHTITTLRPALCGFKVKKIDELQGLTLKNIELKVVVDEKVKFKEFGDITFYKNLVAGPLCLTASSLLNSYNKFDFVIDLKPKVEENEFKERFYNVYNSSKNESFITFLQNFMPSKLAEYIAHKYSINKKERIKNLSSNLIKEIQQSIKNLKFNNLTLDDIENGIVTAGGINIKEINPSNMESKITDNLYFVGEVLDLDAFTGGYNMQIAFTTGYICGKYIAEKSY